MDAYSLAWCLLWLRLVAAWPHYMLDDGCAKGAALVDPTSKPPTIMSIVPFQQHNLLVVEGDSASSLEGQRRKSFIELPARMLRQLAEVDDDAEDRKGGAPETTYAANGTRYAELRGTVVAGQPVRLLYNGVISPYGTHIAFIVSAGKLSGGVPCGNETGQMLCTTCSNPAPVGFLRTASWTPPDLEGVATLAVSAAHAGPGTPSVVIDRLTVRVLPGTDL
mmetsp:Transcript_11810/g.21520  ORF Transcript_11810/g.21520 Transcript_11810/m.21520 type:complete len:221 (+) Transcript_11810:175-837(+)